MSGLWDQFKNVMNELMSATGPASSGASLRVPPSERALGWAKSLLVPGFTDSDLKQLGHVMGILERTSHGLEDLQFAVEKKVQVRFDLRTGGAWYQPHKNLITLNRVSAIPRSALHWVHELTHAREFHRGRPFTVLECTREQYAEMIVAEEAKTYFREAVVGRQLLHGARARRDPTWAQHTTDHPMQMWFQLVHAVPYGRRPDDAVLAADVALTGAELGELYPFVRPYFRGYVEAYRVPEMIKWDIAHKKRPPLDEQTSTGVLSAAFEKQSRAHKDRSFPMRPMGQMRTGSSRR
jgi:hypothetical protein